MNIRFKDVFPAIFFDLSLKESEVWKNALLFEKGKKYLVQAESGGGKSSMLSYIYGERKDYHGLIEYENTDIFKFRDSKWSDLRKNKLSIVFQGLRLFDEISVLENIQLKNKLTDFKTVQEIKQLLTVLEIGDKIDKPAGSLSFGQKQKVAIVRSLCQPFEYLLLDEPFSHLDERNRKIVVDMITNEVDNQNAALIVTTLSDDHYFENIQKIKL